MTWLDLLADKALNRELPTRDEALAVLASTDDELMDVVAARHTLEILETLTRDIQTSVLLVSHQITQALAFADYVLFVDLEHQEVVIDTVQAIEHNPLFRHHFGGLVEHEHG